MSHVENLFLWDAFRRLSCSNHACIRATGGDNVAPAHPRRSRDNLHTDPHAGTVITSTPSRSVAAAHGTVMASTPPTRSHAAAHLLAGTVITSTLTPAVAASHPWGKREKVPRMLLECSGRSFPTRPIQQERIHIRMQGQSTLLFVRSCR